MYYLKKVIEFLLQVFAPVITVAIGAGVAGVGLSIESMVAAWIGLALIAVGVFWGVILYGGLDY